MEHNIPNDIKFESGLNHEDEATKNSSHAPNSGQYCKRCDRAFETIEVYRMHLKLSNMHHVCQYCDYDWQTLEALRRHWQTSHASVYCEYCSRLFSSPEEKRKHSNSKHCFCERCNESFLSEGLRRHHWATSDAHISTYCKICKVDFGNPGAYRIHSFAAHTPRKSQGHDQNANENPKSEKGSKYESGGRGKFEKDSKSQEQDQNSKPKGRKKESHNFREENFKEKKAGNSKDRSYTANMPASEAPPNHYATLKIPSNSSAEEIVKAAKKRRIQVHPDRTKRQEGLLTEDLEALDDEAKNVGFAAEVLSNELLRKQYDKIYRLWYGFHR
ncbi:hypothetical protein MMC07_007767 [Pseudocyphellaria aurata]|nr:hypothetical protein [Pseudocyphellaria aurata]